MSLRSNSLALFASGAFFICASSSVLAHDQEGHMMHGARGGGMKHGRMQEHGMGGGMKHGSMMHKGRRGGMMRGHGGRGMMMRRRPGAGMMRRRMFGQRVTKMMNLSVDDVRNYLEWRLGEIGNKRLKVGEVKAEEGSIIADVATVDDSLVQRLKVNRRTGAITYEN